MSGITGELTDFVHAFLTGVILVLVYQVFRVLRKLIRHRMWAVNVEDVIYWIFVSIYTFVQIHYTSDGKIRAYFVLGIVLGTVFVMILMRIIKNKFKKLYIAVDRKKGRSVDNSK